MADPPLIVCPVDFSDASRTALQYAGVIADHFGARMLVMSVDDPMLASVAATIEELAGATERELRRFTDAALAGSTGGPKLVEVQVVVGKPAAEVLRVARESRADLIVMSSHGRSGAAKRFFGSTTDGVLRSTTTPVLVTPRAGARVESLSDIVRTIGTILAPVDLSPASPHQVTIASGISRSLSLPLVVAYVLEPLFVAPSVRWAVPEVDAERRTHAETELLELARAAAAGSTVETVVVDGDPSEAIANMAAARKAGLIVMGLHSSTLLGPRMGSVTYRVLSTVDALVLAIPPAPGPSFERRR